MAEERNFRTQFYKKVGLHEVEDKRTLGALLNDQPLNEKKIAYFCQRSMVPTAYRTLVWKLLLGITPRYGESQDYVKQQQTLIYNDLWRTIKKMGLTKISDPCINNGFDPFHNLHDLLPQTDSKMAPDTPNPEHYLFMWLISEAKLRYNPREQLKTKESQQFLSVVKRISGFFDNPADILQVSSHLFAVLMKNKNMIADAIQEGIGLLHKENDMLHRHLYRIGIFSSPLLMDLCLSLFYNILPESAIEKVLDKVIAGAYSVLAFVTVSLLLLFRQPLMSVSTVEGVISTLSNIRKEEAEILASTALDQWLKVGMARRL